MYFKFELVVQEEMSFKEKVYGRRTHDRPRPITIAYIEPLAQVSKKRGGGIYVTAFDENQLHTKSIFTSLINYILNQCLPH